MRNLMWPSYGSIQWITTPDCHAGCDAEDILALLGCESLRSTSLVDELLNELTADRFAMDGLLAPTLTVTVQRLAA